MKIALTGDIHADRNALGRTVLRAHDAGCERIFYLGDFGYNFSSDFLDTAKRLHERTGLVIEWLDGNHEDFDYLESVNFDPLPGVLRYHPRGSVETLDGVSFMFLGGATSVDRPWRVPHASWWPQEELTEADVARACTKGKVDVVLAHDAPYLPPISNKGLNSGFPQEELDRSESHRERVRAVYQEAQPTTWVHGHYHHRYTTSIEEPWGPVTFEGLGTNFDLVTVNQIILHTETIG